MKLAAVAAGLVASAPVLAANLKETYYVTAGTIQGMCGGGTKPMVDVFASAIVDTHRTYVEAGRILKEIRGSSVFLQMSSSQRSVGS